MLKARQPWGKLLLGISAYLGLVISLLAIHPHARGGESFSFSATSLFQTGLIAVQADVPRERPRPGSNRPVPAPSGPSHAIVIPEPPPFPTKPEDPIMKWAIVAVAVIALVMIYLIVMMVRRDLQKKKKVNKTKVVKPKSGPVMQDSWLGTGDRRAERGSAVTQTNFGTTVGQTTISAQTMPPISVIQSQWKDIQSNTAERKPLVNPGAIEPDSGLQDSVEKIGYNPFYTVSDAGMGIEVAEIGDLGETEVLIRMGMYEQASQLLERQIAEQEHPSPKIWLMLFDLYLKLNDEEKYNQLAQGFNTYFNAVAPAWGSQHMESPKHLEDYPGVINKIVRLWGLQGCRMYLETLLYDNRSGTRQGFSLAAYDDILFLLDLIQTIKDMGDGSPLQPDPVA